MLVEGSLEHISMQAEMCFDATPEGRRVGYLRPARRPLMECHPHSYGPGLSAIRAAAAGVGGFSLLVVLVYVADEYLAAYACVGAQTL